MIYSENVELIKFIKKKLIEKFRMKDLGQIKMYLGININYDCNENVMTLDQRGYIESLARKYEIENAKLYDTPMEQNLKCEPTLSASNDIKYRNQIGGLHQILATR